MVFVGCPKQKCVLGVQKLQILVLQCGCKDFDSSLVAAFDDVHVLS